MVAFRIKISVILLLCSAGSLIYAQAEEPIRYFQMEPLDDSLFIQIQEAIFIDPPDPKAEIIVDLRDQNNQTVTIQGVLYPLLAFPAELRARIITYPFKIDLEEQINLGSVFTRVIERMNFKKALEPPRKNQIISTLHYINPYIQMLGGERFGVPIRSDVGLSFGFGTPYSGPLETNFAEINFHILGFSVGFFNPIDAVIELKNDNNHNNLVSGSGLQVSYVFPLGNFFEIGYQKVVTDVGDSLRNQTLAQGVPEFNYYPMYTEGSYINWEFRFPFRTLGASRAKLYLASYMGEFHVGFSGRELSLAGSIFDLRFDALASSPERNPQYVLDVLIQRVFESWGFSAFAIGPSMIITRNSSSSYGVTSMFLNLRLKVGTSL